jgi:hypothetical protein
MKGHKLQCATISMIVAGFLYAQGRAQSVANTRHSETISVNQRRPLPAALRIFEERYGVLITYEDPPYSSASDVEDVTPRCASCRGRRQESCAS